MRGYERLREATKYAAIRGRLVARRALDSARHRVRERIQVGVALYIDAL